MQSPHKTFDLDTDTVLLDEFYCSKEGTFGKLYAFRTHVCFVDVFDGAIKDVIPVEVCNVQWQLTIPKSKIK